VQHRIYNALEQGLPNEVCAGLGPRRRAIHVAKVQYSAKAVANHCASTLCRGDEAMTMSTVWKATKAKAARELAQAGVGNVQLARDFVAGFDAGLSKQLDAFDAANKLSDMQKTGRKATETMRAYEAHINRERRKLNDRNTTAKAVFATTSNVLVSLDEMITKRVKRAIEATNSASMTFTSMRNYWKTAKKHIEEEVKSAGDAVDIAGAKRMLGEFESGLGKELDTFEAAFPDGPRMRQSRERILRIVKYYRDFVIVKKEKKAGDDEHSNRLAKDLQGSLNLVFDGIDTHISALVKDLLEKAKAPGTFWSVPTPH
jgi:hypothetical protein